MGKRLMKIKYPHDDKLIGRLKTCLDMCCMPHVIHDDCEYFTIYIDKGRCTWNKVMDEVNRVHAVKFRYESNAWIQNGIVHVEVGDFRIKAVSRSEIQARINKMGSK